MALAVANAALAVGLKTRRCTSRTESTGIAIRLAFLSSPMMLSAVTSGRYTRIHLSARRTRKEDVWCSWQTTTKSSRLMVRQFAHPFRRTITSSKRENTVTLVGCTLMSHEPKSLGAARPRLSFAAKTPRSNESRVRCTRLELPHCSGRWDGRHYCECASNGHNPQQCENCHQVANAQMLPASLRIDIICSSVLCLPVPPIGPPRRSGWQSRATPTAPRIGGIIRSTPVGRLFRGLRPGRVVRPNA